MGKAHHAETQALKVGVPGAVPLEGRPVAVVSVPVDFDDQTPAAPHEIHFIRPQARIDFRLGKAVAATEAEEESLELAAGEVGLPHEIRRADQAEVESAPNSPLVDGLRNGAVKISQGSCGVRHCDSAAAGRNTGNEGVGSVDRDPPARPAAAVAADGGVNRSGVRLEHPPDGSSAGVAYRGTLTQGEYCCHASAIERERRVAHGVNTAMKAVETAGANANRHSIAMKTRGSKLREAHHPLLTGGDLPDHSVAIGALFPYTGTKAPTPIPLPFIALFSSLHCRCSGWRLARRP
jgi:hypothetical protein